jgi:hypothetical protein
LSDREAREAKNGLRRLVDLILARSLVEFFADVYQFGPTTAPPAPDMQRVPLESMPDEDADLRAHLVLPGVGALDELQRVLQAPTTHRTAILTALGARPAYS